MAQLGHADPRFTLRVYTHLLSRRDDERDRLPALVEGEDWAVMGRKDADADVEPAESPRSESPESQSRAGIPAMGVTGLEPVTSSLSSWRSPN